MSTGSAPGRLDLLGGVADYSGALVLQVPTEVRTTVTAEPADVLEVGGVELSPQLIRNLVSRPDIEVRNVLAGLPSWTLYLIGVVVLLVRRGVIDPPCVRLTVDSDVPISMGVSSSAALEVAAARALGAEELLDPLDLAALCQAAENNIVGAPCGIMDQVAVTLGRPGAVLPILCRPASVEDSIDLPPSIEVVGWPSGAAHDVAGDPYGQARTASFMGKRIIEAETGRVWDWTSQLPAELVDALPETVHGDAFRERFGRTDDPLSRVERNVEYHVRAATTFGVAEHARTTQALSHLRAGDIGELGPLLAASHAGYTAMGLGHDATDAIVDEVTELPGVHGARTSGGGSGGTVAVICDKGALDDIEGIIR